METRSAGASQGPRPQGISLLGVGSTGSGELFTAGPPPGPACVPLKVQSRASSDRRHRAVCRAEGTRGLPGRRCQALLDGVPGGDASGGTCRGRLRQLENLQSHWCCTGCPNPQRGQEKISGSFRHPVGTESVQASHSPGSSPWSRDQCPCCGRSQLKEGEGRRGGSRRRPGPDTWGRLPTSPSPAVPLSPAEPAQLGSGCMSCSAVCRGPGVCVRGCKI